MPITRLTRIVLNYVLGLHRSAVIRAVRKLEDKAALAHEKVEQQTQVIFTMQRQLSQLVDDAGEAEAVAAAAHIAASEELGSIPVTLGNGSSL